VYDGPKTWTTKFSRIVYRRADVPDAVVVEYVGDQTLAVDFPHGNATKTSRPYIRSQPSVLTKIASATGSAQSVYQTLVVGAQTSDANNATGVPRNREQVRNVQKAQRNGSRYVI